MPRATVSQTTERFELQTLPEGYVIIRRMSYGEKLDRQDDMMNMRTISDGSDSKSFSAEIQMLQKKVALKDFANLVIEHNLTDDKDRPLNFKNQVDVLQLDPRVGDEIGTYIDQINSFESEPLTKKS